MQTTGHATPRFSAVAERDRTEAATATLQIQFNAERELYFEKGKHALADLDGELQDRLRGERRTDAGHHR